MKKSLLMFSMLFSIGLFAQVTPSGTPVNTVTITTTGTGKNIITKQESTSTKNQFQVGAVQGTKSASSSSATTPSLSVSRMDASDGTASQQGSVQVMPTNTTIYAEDDNSQHYGNVGVGIDSIRIRSTDESTGTYSELKLKPISISELVINGSQKTTTFKDWTKVETVVESGANRVTDLVSPAISRLESTDGDQIGRVLVRPTIATMAVVDNDVTGGTITCELGFVQQQATDGTNITTLSANPTYAEGISTDGTTSSGYSMGSGAYSMYTSNASGNTKLVLNPEDCNIGADDGGSNTSNTVFTPTSIISTSTDGTYTTVVKATPTNAFIESEIGDANSISNFSPDIVSFIVKDLTNQSSSLITPTLQILESTVGDFSVKILNDPLFDADGTGILATNTATGAVGQLSVQPTAVNMSAGSGANSANSTVTATQITNNVVGALSNTSFVQTSANMTATAETIYLFAGASGIESSDASIAITSADVSVDGNLNPRNIMLSSGTTGRAPFRFSTGTFTTTPVNGAVEYNGTKYTITAGGVRDTIATQEWTATNFASSGFADNSTTVVLSKSDLNTSYPSAVRGFKVYALSITVGAMVYEKVGGTDWIGTATVVTL